MNRTLIVVIAASLVVFAFVVTMLSIDRVVMRSIERYGSEALGVEVSVGDVTIRLAKGRGRISGLRVAQPEGFGSGDALAFGEIVLDLDVASLAAGDPYVLELVRVADPVVLYVLGEDGTSNLDVIQRNLAGGNEAGARTSSNDAVKVASGDPLRLRIDRLEIEGGRIRADVRTAGLGAREAKLPALRVDRLGGTQGLPPETLATRIGQRFLTHSVAAVTVSGIGGLVKRGGSALRNVFDSLVR